MNAVVTKVCIGSPTQISHQGDTVSTGIFKKPVNQVLKAGSLGLDGDVQVDLRFHGGRDKAIYVYPDAHYFYWQEKLGKEELEDSRFGENLNVSELDDRTVNIGDRFKVGTAIVEVTQPRIPCFKLGIRVKDDSFPAQFLTAGRLGFYLRVETEGQLQQGNSFDLLDRKSHGISVFDLWHATFTQEGNKMVAEQALEKLPYLDAGWKKRLQAKLR